MFNRINALTILALILHLAVSRDARGSEVCNHWLPGPLHHQPEGISSAGIITASAVWSPATGGTFLVVGGSFSTAGGVPVNNIAMWDGASWRALGGGVNGMVHALAVYNGDLIAGGQFTHAGGVPVNFIARFDGVSWHPLGNGLVENASNFAAGCFALATFEGDLIAGGTFDQSGNTVLINLGRWNGATWSAVGSNSPPFSGVGVIGEGDSVAALRVHNNALYIGGTFDVAGGVVAANNIARFAGGTYAALTSGTLGSVGVLHSFGADLIVGGAFIQAGGLSANHVARWTPGAGTSGTWAAMSSGLGAGAESVTALQPFNGQLIAGGTFPGSVRAWNGSSWLGVGGGTAGNFDDTHTLNVFNSNLIAAGIFTSAGGVPATNIAQWSGSAWSALQTSAPQVLAFATLGSRFIAAGSFLQSTTSQTPAHNIIGWNGSTLTGVRNGICCGEGTNGVIRALKGFTGLGTSHLVAGGDFTVAGGVTANRIAQYNQLQLAGSGWVTMGAGFNNSVHAIERFNNATYAGGTFTQSGGTSINRIARFDGTNWIALGSGINGPVYAMKVFNGELYVGGDFTIAGGVSTGGLARWNGATWSVVGLPISGDVFALEVHNNELIIGGSFLIAGSGSPNIIRWVGGSSFASLGPGGTNGAVNALTSDGTHLYAIGGFTLAGGVNVNRIARWNAADNWSDVEGGTNDVVNTLGLYRGEIQVGLGINFGLDGPENPAPQPGKGWVRYSPTGVVWIAGNPGSQTVNCGQTATFTAQPAQGYSLLLATWRRNGVALNDGPTPHGSTINGAHASTLIIFNARTADAGSYDCVFGNLCGSATSSAATLTVNNCCAADITGNDDVNVDDLLVVINQWGPCPLPPPPAQCIADIAPPAGGNSLVNVDDLLTVINAWGPCP